MKSRSDVTTGQKVLAGYNLLTAAAVLYDYTQNPNASSAEYLPDVAIHTLSGLISLGYFDNIETQLAATGGNIARIAQIAYKLLVSGDSTIATAANVADVFNHSANLYSFHNKKSVKDDKSVQDDKSVANKSHAHPKSK